MIGGMYDKTTRIVPKGPLIASTWYGDAQYDGIAYSYVHLNPFGSAHLRDVMKLLDKFNMLNDCISSFDIGSRSCLTIWLK